MDAAMPPPPPPPIAEVRLTDQFSGDRLTIGGIDISSAWLWQGQGATNPKRLWLPLDLLVGQMGFQRQSDVRGERLEWYGVQRAFSGLQQRTIGDEVALDALPWLKALGVQVNRINNTLRVELPQPHLKTLRQGKGSSANRLVMDLSGPALVQRQGDDLLVQMKVTPLQESHLRRIGLQPRREPGGLKLLGQASKLSTLTLNGPWRVVLDGITPTNPSTRRLQ